MHFVGLFLFLLLKMHGPKNKIGPQCRYMNQTPPAPSVAKRSYSPRPGRTDRHHDLCPQDGGIVLPQNVDDLSQHARTVSMQEQEQHQLLVHG